MLAGDRVKERNLCCLVELEFQVTDREYKYALHAADKNPAEESSAGIRTVLQAELFISPPEERVRSVEESPLQAH